MSLGLRPAPVASEIFLKAYATFLFSWKQIYGCTCVYIFFWLMRPRKITSRCDRLKENLCSRPRTSMEYVAVLMTFAWSFIGRCSHGHVIVCLFWFSCQFECVHIFHLAECSGEDGIQHPFISNNFLASRAEHLHSVQFLGLGPDCFSHFDWFVVKI